MVMRAFLPGSKEAVALGFDKEDPAPRALNLAAFKRAADRPALSTDITVSFADGDYRFWLGTAQLKELERVQDAGFALIYSRLAKGRFLFAGQAADFSQIEVADPFNAEFMAADVMQVIRLGLIGGGGGMVDGDEVKVDQHRAKRLMEVYVVDQPFKDAWTLAFAIMGARMHGVPAAPEVAA